jgi:hypothetical protein
MKKIYQLIPALAFCAAGFAQTTTVSFTSSGNFIVPAGVTSVTIEVVGAGGDGGSNGGGGGGGGGYAMGTYPVTPGSTLAVTVGTNGMGAVAGTTSVDLLIAASGGENGSSGGASPGGAGGTGVNGLVNRTGGAGGNGTWTYFGGGGGGAAGSISNGTMGGSTPGWTGSNCLQPGGSAGPGGGAPGGNGGKGSGFIDGSCNSDNPATPGMNYGGGGGGGNGNSGPASDGAMGYCLISYCDLDLSTSVTGNTITANAVSPTSYEWIDCATNLPIPGETSSTYTATANGDYAVVITDGDCSDTSDCVTINCSLDLSTTLVGFSITSNDVDATTYQWIDCSTNLPIAGETGISYSPVSNGDYAVALTEGICSDTSACVSVNGIGLADPGAAIKPTVYPNPFTNSIRIENETGAEYFELVNSRGRLVWSGTDIEATDFTNLPQGVYVLTIHAETFIQKYAMVKL